MFQQHHIIRQPTPHKWFRHAKAMQNTTRTVYKQQPYLKKHHTNPRKKNKQQNTTKKLPKQTKSKTTIIISKDNY